VSQYPAWMKFSVGNDGLSPKIQAAAERLGLRWRWRDLSNQTFEVEVKKPMDAYELGRATFPTLHS
jgi:hypothetical protein